MGKVKVPITNMVFTMHRLFCKTFSEDSIQICTKNRCACNHYKIYV